MTGAASLMMLTLAAESIVYPLAYNKSCWSSVVLRNASDSPVAFQAAAHRANGSPAPFAGTTSAQTTLAPGAKTAFRLQVENEEESGAWVQVREEQDDTGRFARIAVSGATECLSGNDLVIQPAVVFHPTANPWFEGDASDLDAKDVWLLNVSEDAASATACYSTGATAQSPGSDPVPVCGASDSIYLPPFAMKNVAAQKNGSSHVILRTKGQALVLQAVPKAGIATRKYTVDSTVTFDDIPAEPGK